MQIFRTTANPNVQLATIRLHMSRATKSEYESLIKTIQQVDPCAVCTAGHLTRESMTSTQYYNTKVSFTLVLHDEELMKKYRKAMFKLRLLYPSLYTS